MLSLPELKRRAAKEGVPQGILEKDYVLSVVLNAIAESDLSQHLVFKGGTAIKKVYFSEARFSEDLDFTVVDSDKDSILEGLDIALNGRTIDGVKFEKPEEERTSAGLKVSVMYTGPLAYTHRVLLDFSLRENLVGEPVRKPLIDPYGPGGHEPLVISLEELFAEKIHALGSRSAPRDLYDVWFLAGKGVKPDQNVVGKKFAYYGETLNKQKIAVAIQQMKNDWQRDLGPLLKALPEFSSVAEEVMKLIEKIPATR